MADDKMTDAIAAAVDKLTAQGGGKAKIGGETAGTGFGLPDPYGNIVVPLPDASDG